MKKQILFIIFLSFLLCFLFNSAYSQTSIQEVINKYSAVDSIYPSKDTIEVANPGLYQAGDTVMMYQAKGAVSETDTSFLANLFGTIRLQSDIKNAGNYEIILIKEINGNQIIFKAKLENNYDVKGLVQLIYVPSYKSVSVIGELTCKSWEDSTATGGVLVLMVSDTMYLNADINVTAKGFRGANPYLYINTDAQSCSSSDTVLYTSYYFSDNTDTVCAGYKAEGLTENDPLFSKGLGKWANGGGGGNGRFSGGGGGSSQGQGGIGGAEDITYCSTLGDVWSRIGGVGGTALYAINAFNDSTIFMGGGGGSGTYINGLTATKGGNGGGIVILIVKNLKTSGHQIKANGESVAGVATASAGGGGGAGAIVFDVDTIMGNISLHCDGGQGGFVQTLGNSGPGGGGGGGVIFWNSVKPASATASVSYGKSGYVWPVEDNPYYAAPGALGNASSFTNVKVPLTGFLFNTITADQKVCEGDIPDLLVGSNPRGGNGIYTYQWQKSLDNSIWNDITDSIRIDFQPPVPVSPDTILYYRRIVESGGIIDVSYEVQIIVHSVIKNNGISIGDMVTCIGNEADTITGTKATVSGGDYINYSYIWQYSTDSLSWITDVALNDTTYLHGTITDTTYVRRIVNSGACYDTTNLTPAPKIIGLPAISNNVLSGNQEICFGSTPDEITGEILQGGLGSSSYSYKWIEKAEGASTWDTIPGETGETLILPELYQTMYYKRLVKSDDCMDISNSDTINVLPLIGNNTIDNTNPVFTCKNVAPEILNGSVPSGGNNTYSYQWQDSIISGTWNDITNADLEDYQSIALTDTTFFRRIVKSGLNDCCKDTTAALKVKIHDLPVAVIADMDDTICSKTEVNLNFDFSSSPVPYAFPYTLVYNDGVSNSTSFIFNEEKPQISVIPETDPESKVFDYTIFSLEDKYGCFATDKTGLAKITVYGVPTPNAGIDEENCNLSYLFSANKTWPDNDSYWTQIAGPGTTTFSDHTLPNAIINADTAGVYTYKWEETNWECVNSDTVKIILYKNLFNIDVLKPFNKGEDIDTTLRFINELNFIGNYNNPDQFKNIIEKRWSIQVGSASISPSDTSRNVVFTDLNDEGNDHIEVQWYVDKGACADTTIIRRIKLNEIFTPTGFTPNGDGVNDYLKFDGLEHSDENELIIFNRWGTEVYRAPNFSNDPGWNGQNKDGKDLPDDTYFYVLSFTKGNSTQTTKGFIVIKRF